MKIGIATAQVPFVYGGAEIHALSLKEELLKRGFKVEIITLPFSYHNPKVLLDNMLAARLIDLTDRNEIKIDKLITLKFPAYYFSHKNKVAWILHQHRAAYNLYGTKYSNLHETEMGRSVAKEIELWDRTLLPKHNLLFTNSKKVANRLLQYNGISAEPLYHPPCNYERYYSASSSQYILAPGRFNNIKRQHLIIESMLHTNSNLKLILIGPYDCEYGKKLLKNLHKQGLEKRVEFRGVVNEDEKIHLYANCLAVYNGVYDEDYGYITLEAFLASKPVITHTDSGGPLEFVTDGENGFIIPPFPEYIGECLNRLKNEANLASLMGKAGFATLQALEITWDNTIERLLG